MDQLPDSMLAEAKNMRVFPPFLSETVQLTPISCTRVANKVRRSTPVHGARLSDPQRLSIGCAAILFYDYLLTFSDEVRLDRIASVG